MNANVHVCETKEGTALTPIHCVPALHTLLEKTAKLVLRQDKTKAWWTPGVVRVPGSRSSPRGGVLLTVCPPAVFWLVLLRSIMYLTSVTVWQGRRWGSSRHIGLTVNKLIYSNKHSQPIFVSPTTHPRWAFQMEGPSRPSHSVRGKERFQNWAES